MPPILIDIVSVTIITPTVVVLLVRAQESEGHLLNVYRMIGHISYPLYLCQMPIILVAVAISANWTASKLIPLGIAVAAITLLVSWVVTRWLEPSLSRSHGERPAGTQIRESVQSRIGAFLEPNQHDPRADLYFGNGEGGPATAGMDIRASDKGLA